MLKYLYRFLILIIVLAGIAEVVLRVRYGFCNSPLYISDPDFEYIYAPNQDVTRFGYALRTNSLSMRSEEVLPTDSLVILLIGDSVVNGGSLTDQDSIATTLLEKRFLRDFNQRVRVLNISAGSWGPDNMAAFLKKYGLFKAKLMCLVTSSHDAHDIMSHQNTVGVNPGMPDKQYKVALYELWDRYRWIFFYYWNTVFFAPEVQETGGAQPDSLRREELKAAGIRKPGVGFNPGYGQLYSMAQAHNIPFFIYLHPEISEVELGHFNDQGDEIIAFAQSHNIRLINELQMGIKPSFYRKMDVIHYNSQGQQFMADNLYPLFKDYLKLGK
ncbi:hypothetical protein [Dyadobacter sandarakinus]|uniref:SGNH/GDSL hydrolase family protein n=1 Tax=Dyadobacter sandarakinus TaxID=2747268 RepID=A0ABX7I0S4_9BACT|nr:hypothetical protein [Dyadobacter sandarakinus]QRQ99641.1 hypothetical protein HWI92_01280 [Dyadobacter sandarakinus]